MVAINVLNPLYSLLTIIMTSTVWVTIVNGRTVLVCSARRHDLDSCVRVSGLQQSVQAQDFAEPPPASRVSLQLCQVWSVRVHQLWPARAAATLSGPTLLDQHYTTYYIKYRALM